MVEGTPIRLLHIYTMSSHHVIRLNQAHAVSHTICGVCVPRRRCRIVSLSLRLKRELEQQDFFCVLSLPVEYAERGKEYGILFTFSLFCEYVHLEYVRIHVVYRVN